MMNCYRFPHISRIEQCLEAIKGAENFIVAERDGHTIINYIMMDSHTFPPVTERFIEIDSIFNAPERYNHNAAIRRECRGIIFDSNGNLISRRLHKFFNVNERPETVIENIDVTKPHVILKKMDGSMITPIPIRNHIRWGTKMGLTSVGFQAEEFVSTRKEYLDLGEYCAEAGITPIFEWCSRKQRIVVDYPQDNLVLLAIRVNLTGAYLSYADLVTFGHFWKVPVVDTWKTLDGISNIRDRRTQEFVDGVSDEEGTEGYVLRFEDGHSVKIKSQWYLRIHRAKDSLLQEKRVVEMIVNEKCDDVLPYLLDHDKKALEGFRDEFWRGLRATADGISWVFDHWYHKTDGDKKRFAVEAELPSHIKSICFSVWQNETNWESISEELKKRVLKNLGSGTKVEANRWIWSGAKWADYIQAEDENES